MTLRTFSFIKSFLHLRSWKSAFDGIFTCFFFTLRVLSHLEFILSPGSIFILCPYGEPIVPHHVLKTPNFPCCRLMPARKDRAWCDLTVSGMVLSHTQERDGTGLAGPMISKMLDNIVSVDILQKVTSNFPSSSKCHGHFQDHTGAGAPFWKGLVIVLKLKAPC